MLNFDDNHKYIEGNINRKKGKQKFKKIVIAGLIVANLLTFSGCVKDVPCDIEGKHAHYYVNDDYFGRYIVSEKSSVLGLDRSDNYILVNDEEASLLEFINKKDLFKINENKQAISDITDSHYDYVEYRYQYFYMLPIPIVQANGNVMYNYIPMTGYSWSTDTDRTLTGEKRVCHYVYYGYKITKNERGVYELSKSEPVDDLSQLPEGYDYIEEKFYDVVNLYNKNEVLQYEDGPEGDKKIISEDEYNKSKGKTR